ncbi:MAG TPA: sugar ABC transporter permease [Anaerolineaceae bacterium]|nr:sugar ABC transporter permease [Anaerolineaceae bacterium]
MMQKNKKNINKAFLLVITISMVFLMVLPYLWMITASLKERGHVSDPPYLFPKTFDFSNYTKAWNGAPFGKYYLNTIFVAVVVVVSRILFGSLAAYVFAFIKFKGRDFIYFLYISTMMIPFYAIVIPMYLLVNDFGWLNSYQALIIPRLADAFSIMILRQSFISIPHDYIDAAKMDGASHWHILWKIVVPMSLPSVITSAIFSFLYIWNDFFWPFLVANEPELRVIQIGLQAFTGQYLTEWTYWMAGTVIASLPPVLIFIFGQKYYISGLSRTGLK